MNASTLAPAVVGSTLLGGLLAVRLRTRLHLILGFSAGAVVGVAVFDLLPEAFQLSNGSSQALTPLLVGSGFLLYLVLDRLLQRSGSVAGEVSPSHAQRSARGTLGATSLVMHSFMDGVAIGFGFQISQDVGLAVGAAVIAHDFSDGINTSNVILKNGGTVNRALGWLLADALVPVVGIAAASLVHLPPRWFGCCLALLAGFFLYLGASDLVPESQRRHPGLFTTLATLLGAAVVCAATLHAS
jgi:zinc transporter ZupT